MGVSEKTTEHSLFFGVSKKWSVRFSSRLYRRKVELANMSGKKEDGAVGTMVDVLRWIECEAGYTDGTKKIYRDAIRRCLKVYQVNSLASIPADVVAFEGRFHRKNYDPDLFKTFKSYKGWRQRVVSILKKSSGATTANTVVPNDLWSKLLFECERLVDGTFGRRRQELIPIVQLAKEARRSGRQPHELDGAWLSTLSDALDARRRRTISQAVRRLNEYRHLSSEIAGTLPTCDLEVPDRVRRSAPDHIPFHLQQQAHQLIESASSGEMDEISGEAVFGLSKAAQNVRQAALNKYLRTGLMIGVIRHEILAFEKIFDRPVFLEIVRAWIQDQDGNIRISERTMRSYITNIAILAEWLHLDTSFMRASLKINPTLKKGQRDAQEMSEPAKAFCQHLLRNRRAELTFQSLHLAFMRDAQSLRAEVFNSPYKERRIIQLGVLACFSAIALWGVPLRVSNMLQLRHRGEDANLILPVGARRQAYVLLPAHSVKNKRDIKASLVDGPTRALEVLIWYLDEIRPEIHGSEESDFLFPGYGGGQLSSTVLRGWLHRHARNHHLQMFPHNFRHGLASLYLRAQPGDYAGAARLLCNTPNVVRKYYAWIDEERELLEVQDKIIKMAGFSK
ncbi:tyrosine-type recombinase/integrase [Thioclava sp. F36-6]|uniref:tyrosine-type recombinase/integrase n=2 Tax=Paracoccaceae TaxID=31989 RepID=UPI0011BAA70D|nr:tyrosine-type recombinase/integrase [Thioclava sp. F36-6]